MPERYGGSERYARDARAAELMRPWTEEIATQQAWEAALGLGAQRGSAVGALSYFRRLQYTYRELSSTR